ncbi:hypothetical protein ACFQ36_08320 [Arthrobacter sp. GCM10027362]|uniref:hypothetical protein n=1 Tax=Arthrobacter sp. GCM10027362 TaxID=3273379 RepID=UPI0036355358
MPKSHTPAREPEPTEAFGGTAPMEVQQSPGREAAPADDRPEETFGAGSAALPPRNMEEIPHATVAEMIRIEREPGR